MNKYEEKVKGRINYIVTGISEIKSEILNNSCEIKKLQEQCDSISVSIDVIDNTVAKECLKNSVEEIKRKVENLTYQIDQLNVKKKEYESNLSVLSLVCPHEDTEYDYEDYHRNITYYKCKLCGKGKL